MDIDDETVISRVGAWKNKAEFNLVYDWLYGPGANNETKQLALSRMKLWKVRRGNLTPASVLSTLTILDVQLIDRLDNGFTNDALRSLYSNAFTRFVNYMSSIMRSKTVQSMYSSARELGIETFLVDLRHLCVHGQVLPSLEIMRRTTDYCMEWLREFYWEREKNVITDATVHDVHLKSTVELQMAIAEWFKLYDTATEAMIRGCKDIDDLTQIKPDERLTHECIEQLKNISQQIHNKKLSFIANKSINQLALLSTSNERDRGDAEIYCDVLFDCQYFMKRSAEYYNNKMTKEATDKFIGIHQNLFRMFAICDFINAIFVRLFTVCEDDSRDEYFKRAACFWANEIATGFLVFKEFKMLYRAKREKNFKYDIDLAPINTDVMTDDIQKFYRELGVNFRGTLIFGDSVRRPWSLHFDCDFLIERSTNINEFTVEFVKKCIQLIEPALDKVQAHHIERLFSIYTDVKHTKSFEHQSRDNEPIHTLDDYKIVNLPQSIGINGSSDNIWSDSPDELDWKSCPIGGFA